MADRLSWHVAITSNKFEAYPSIRNMAFILLCLQLLMLNEVLLIRFLLVFVQKLRLR